MTATRSGCCPAMRQNPTAGSAIPSRRSTISVYSIRVGAKDQSRPRELRGAPFEVGLACFASVIEPLQSRRVVLLGAVRLLQRKPLDPVHGLLREPHRDRALRRELRRQFTRRTVEI